MRWMAFGVMMAACLELAAAEPPLVEKYLHSGELARGEQVLEAALEASPGDDQLRFSLGVLQLFLGVERLGQALYEYGVKPENNNTPFLRIPVPKNPEPSPIAYADLRRFLSVFQNDLATAETTLAGVTDDHVALTLRLMDIRFDLSGSGDATERLSDVLKKLMGPNFRPPPGNAEFQVRFDRGDVAWLRAYCHLLMAMIDAQLAVDLEAQFNLHADELFARPKHPFQGTPQEKRDKQHEFWSVLHIREPARLRHFREHLLKVCELNRETWRYIRAERDDELEWLPNPKQKGVLGLPVRDEMIDVWLAMVEELEGLLNGRKVIPASVVQFLYSPTKKGLSVRALLDDPPDQIAWDELRETGIREKYLDDTGQDVNVVSFIRVLNVFQNTLGVAYAVWFN